MRERYHKVWQRGYDEAMLKATADLATVLRSGYQVGPNPFGAVFNVRSPDKQRIWTVSNIAIIKEVMRP